MDLRCRCHGLSGTCSLRTCWMTLPNFQVIGDYLRRKYEASVHLPTAVDLNELIPMMNRNELSAILSGQSAAIAPPPPSPLGHSNFIQITTNQPSLEHETSAGASPDSVTSNRSRDEPSTGDSEPLMADAPSPARAPLSGHFIPVTPVSSSANPPTPAPSHFNFYYERHKQLQQAGVSLPTSPPAANRQKQPDPVSGDLMQILTNTTLLSQEEYQTLLKDMKLCNNAVSRAKDAGQQAGSNQVSLTGSTGQKQLHKRLSQQQHSQALGGQQSQHLIKIANQHLSQLLHSNKDELIHLHKSPDYCEADPRHGFPGIQSRVCSNNPLAPNNCDKLCCGRGFTTHVYQQTFKCDCKFQYCCSIYCSVCEKEVKVIDCN